MEDKKTSFFKQHMFDLANRAYQNNYPVFTDFLTTYEYSMLLRLQNSFTGIHIVFYGGCRDCEHMMGGFFPLHEQYDVYTVFPIACLYISPINGKYSQELSHRDYLGALINLGIERSMIGDIRICEQSAYVFCKENFVSYIMEHLSMVKHTSVSCKRISDVTSFPSQKYEEKTMSVSSLRLDNVVAAMIGSARGKAALLITQGNVIVQHEERTSVSYTCKSDMIFTIRGYGKYRLEYNDNDYTKKGKQKIRIYQFI